MNPKTMQERVMALRALGLDPATVDPAYDIFSNGERGKLHLDANCYKLNTSRPVKRCAKFSETKPTKFCDECVDNALRLNADLKKMMPVVALKIEMDKLDRTIREGSVTTRLDAQRKLLSLSGSLDELSEKAVVTHGVISLVRAELDRILSDAEQNCSGDANEVQLLRVLAFSLLVEPRVATVIGDADDIALFGTNRVGDLTELHHVWRDSYEECADRGKAFGAAMKVFYDHSRPTSWSQMNFKVDEAVVSGNLADYAKTVWKQRAESTLRRLCDVWADSVDAASNLKERDHLVVFHQRYELEDEFAAIASIYKVGEVDGVVALQAPGVVSTFFQRMSTYNWHISHVQLFKGKIDVNDIRTALTLYGGGNSTYNDFEEAISAARML